MKKIMFVGAGTFQLPGIMRAKQMGYEVIATDGNSDAPGKAFADRFYHVDVRDLTTNAEIAERHQIDGIVSIASEVSVETVAYIGEQMHLTGNSYDTARLAHNKERYYRRLMEVGVPIPQTWVYKDGISPDFGNHEEVIVKPSKGSGSRLVTRINQAQLDPFIKANAKHLAREECFLVQPYIDGKEITVDGFVYQNQVYILAVSEEKNEPSMRTRVSWELVFPPAWISRQWFDKICAISREAVEALEIEYGPFHLELILSEEQQLYLIDFALRGGGFHLFTDIVQKTSGVDILSLYLQSAAGEPVQLDQPVRFRPVIMRFMYSEQHGVIQDIHVPDERTVPQDYKLTILKKNGDAVQPPKSGADRLAALIVWGDELDEVKQRTDQLEKDIHFLIGTREGIQ